MLKKLINKIIMGTKCYILLKERCNVLEKENNDIRAYVQKLLEMLSQDKTIARRIVRRVNGLIKREDSVQATKEIKALCNQIFKGE